MTEHVIEAACCSLAISFFPHKFVENSRYNNSSSLVHHLIAFIFIPHDELITILQHYQHEILYPYNIYIQYKRVHIGHNVTVPIVALPLDWFFDQECSITTLQCYGNTDRVTDSEPR